jgi:lactobin A/cerein 7B family class IIb bacteriocin
MDFAREFERNAKTTLQEPTDQTRELTLSELEDVSGGIVWLAVLVPLACFATGVAVGATLAK